MLMALILILFRKAMWFQGGVLTPNEIWNVILVISILIIHYFCYFLKFAVIGTLPFSLFQNNNEA